MLPGLAVGLPVSQGQQIGTIDVSGCTSGPHTHIARYLSGVAVNFTMSGCVMRFDGGNMFFDDRDPDPDD